MPTLRPDKSMDVREKHQPFYQTFLFNLKLRGDGFAPRHFNHSIFYFTTKKYVCTTLSN